MKLCEGFNMQFCLIHIVYLFHESPRDKKVTKVIEKGASIAPHSFSLFMSSSLATNPFSLFTYLPSLATNPFSLSTSLLFCYPQTYFRYPQTCFSLCTYRTCVGLTDPLHYQQTFFVIQKPFFFFLPINLPSLSLNLLSSSTCLVRSSSCRSYYQLCYFNILVSLLFFWFSACTPPPHQFQFARSHIPGSVSTLSAISKLYHVIST